MINLMNYYEHPGDNRYYIFEYRMVEKSMEFEALLEEYSVKFEKLVEEGEEEGGVDWKALYAISRDDFKLALRANNLTEAKYRTPFIGNVYLRYTFVIIMLGLVGVISLRIFEIELGESNKFNSRYVVDLRFSVAQENVTTVGFQVKPMIQTKFVDTGGGESSSEWINAEFSSQGGYSMGMVIRRGFTPLFMISTLEVQ